MLRLFNTLKYLKCKQIYYRIYYLIRKKVFKKTPCTKSFNYRVAENSKLIESILSFKAFSNKKFNFLNIEHQFGDNIDWNYSAYGKLWTYNLTYFDFLHQNDLSKEKGIFLLQDFIENFANLKDALEPFPISLRAMNWIKYIVKNDINNESINKSLYCQYRILMKNIEYHLLGNHLLENGFSLLFGAYYFEDEIFYNKAKELLVYELNEQVLEDGAHFELSPMYHQIMLFRVLDCINLIENSSWKEKELLSLMQTKARLMLGWLNMMTFKNGSIPLFNDSAKKIAPTTIELNTYADRLGLQPDSIVLSESGYRKVETDRYELVVDIGKIGPDYIPGHAHSDTFSFELNIDGAPIVVDTGTSTYETNERRTLERSTDSHNTVMLNKKNQSEVWGGFRVAKRAKIIKLVEKDNVIEATHDGYKSINVYHTRKFTSLDRSILIEDSIDGDLLNAVAYLHFHPDVNVELKENKIFVNEFIFECNTSKIRLDNYEYAPEFNTLENAQRVSISFDKKLKMEIKL